MPLLKLKSIHSFSSEDSSHPASNLLTDKKWLCQKAGESLIHVIVQLDRPSLINAIEIRNEHSAYVGVLVAKGAEATDDDFKEILLMTSLMLPEESKESRKTNEEKMFAKNALIETVANTKWDLVKIFCTQPFNKSVQYGLSSIKLHTPIEQPVNDTIAQASPFDKFKLRKDSSESESECSSSLFARWKQSKMKKEAGSSVTSAAAAIRDSSSPAAIKKFSHSLNQSKFSPRPSATKKSRLCDSDNDDDDVKPKPANRNRNELIYDDEDDRPNKKLDDKIQQEKDRVQKPDKKLVESKVSQNSQKERSFKTFLNASSSEDENEKKPQNKKPAEKRPTKTPENKKIVSVKKNYTPVASTSSLPVANKRSLSPVVSSQQSKRSKVKEPTYKSFSKLLEGVVLVISGIQNPARATLRQQALDMGAKYKGDWDNSCTHLICAFKNTPKYQQVHGHGKIIRKEWITQCHGKKMRIPWRRYALDESEGDVDESEDEILDISRKPASQEATVVTQPEISDKDQSDDDNSLAGYDLTAASTSPTAKNKKPIRNEFVSSGSDTEDEIERILQKQKIKPPANGKVEDDDDDAYGATTEEDQKPNGAATTKSRTPLPELFKTKTFYLSKNIGSVEAIKLKTLIEVYLGQLTNNPMNSDYILSNSAKSTPAAYGGEVVKPLWVFECNDMECLLPTKRYKFEIDRK